MVCIGATESAESLSAYRQRLKTRLFSKSFLGDFMDITNGTLYCFCHCFLGHFKNIIMIDRLIDLMASTTVLLAAYYYNYRD